MNASVRLSATQILQIHQERIKPGALPAYARLQEMAAHVCLQLKCPHPFLALESLLEPKEVWLLNGYSSEAQHMKVVQAYENNVRLMSALAQIASQKTEFAFPALEFFSHLHHDLNAGLPWVLGKGRFLVISSRRSARGTVFVAQQGQAFFVIPARSKEAARQIAGDDDYVLAVRPEWSVPAEAWIKSDPDFWRTGVSLDV